MAEDVSIWAAIDDYPHRWIFFMKGSLFEILNINNYLLYKDMVEQWHPDQRIKFHFLHVCCNPSVSVLCFGSRAGRVCVHAVSYVLQSCWRAPTWLGDVFLVNTWGLHNVAGTSRQLISCDKYHGFFFFFCECYHGQMALDVVYVIDL